MKSVFTTADILIPNDISQAWSVIACDQFSSELKYWESVRKIVGDKPSTLNMIIPEAHLEEIDEESKIRKISSVMDDYLNNGILREIKDSFIYVERIQSDGRLRKGIVGTVDLEEYDFTGTASAIRASEGTVLDRLPARIRVRRAATLELPHIITFIDDKDRTVVEPLTKISDDLPLLYDFELMEGGGFIKGRRVTGENAEKVKTAIHKLHEKNDLLMIIGDGNHSLAASKVYWDELKQSLSSADRENHPARHALVELNNVYDPAISFEAIHRVLFSINAPEFIKKFEDVVPRGSDYEIHWLSRNESGSIGIKADCIGDMLKMMQDFIDRYIEKTGAGVDYIHGEDSVKKLAGENHSLGLILPSMDKSDFFETVSGSGVFPRKSFSVGHARDKRYYMECRRIR